METEKPDKTTETGGAASEPAPESARAADPRALPPGFRPDAGRLALFAAGAVLAWVLYSRFGMDSGERSVFHWVFRQWTGDRVSFSDLWIMPLVCLAAAWMSRRRLAEAEVRPSAWGVLLVAACLFVHAVGYRSQFPRISLVSSVGVFWGLVLAVWGPGAARALGFPALYLLLCFGCSTLVYFTMPLRLAASEIACALLQGVGIDAVRRGTVVHSAAGGGFSFNVADPCSGLRSLVTMTALALPYAYFTLKSNAKRFVLFALSVPLAMIANALRIFTIGLVAEWIGMQLAMQLYHDLSGYIVFILSILLLVAAGSLVGRDWRAWFCKLASRKRSRA